MSDVTELLGWKRPLTSSSPTVSWGCCWSWGWAVQRGDVHGPMPVVPYQSPGVVVPNRNTVPANLVSSVGALGAFTQVINKGAGQGRHVKEH